MHLQATDLEERTDRFADSLSDLVRQADDSANAKRISKALLNDSAALKRGYREACASASPEQFIERIAFVARKAKRVKTSMVLFVQLDHLDIDIARETILEARALEAIFVASRNTAKRRHRGRLVSRRNPSERAGYASDGKPARRRRDPRGVT